MGRLTFLLECLKAFCSREEDLGLFLMDVRSFFNEYQNSLECLNIKNAQIAKSYTTVGSAWHCVFIVVGVRRSFQYLNGNLDFLP